MPETINRRAHWQYQAIVCAAQVLITSFSSPVSATDSMWVSSTTHHSTDDETRLNKAFHLAQERRFEQSAHLFDSFKTFDELTYPAAQTVCETQVLAGEFKQALKTANGLLARSDQVSDAYKGKTIKLKADALSGLAEVDLAVSNYQTAAKLNPDVAYYMLLHAGELLLKAKKYEAAIRVIDQALASGSPNGMANKYKGLCYLRLGKPQEAVKALNLSISQIESQRRAKPDAFTTALSEDYRLIVEAYKLENRADLAAAAQKKADALVSGWNDTLFGGPAPSLR